MHKSIEEIENWWSSFSDMMNQRKVVAEKHFSNKSWCFAFCGLQESDIDCKLNLNINVAMEFRTIKQNPMYIELSEVMKDKQQVSRVAGYADHITHELCLYSIVDDEDEYYANSIFLAYRIIAALRIHCGLDFIVPMVANHSWSSIAALEQDSLKIHMIEDYPRAQIFDNSEALQRTDLEWLEKYFVNVLDLIWKHPSINIAIEAISLFHQQVSLRMSVIALWAGIEAIFGITSELRYRLAIEIAAYLEVDNKDRVNLYKKIKKMYDIRSKAVHGSNIDEKIIIEHIKETKSILRRILIKSIEANNLPSHEEFEYSVFTESI